MLHNKVWKVLSENENSRSNDHLLVLKVWEQYGFHLTDEQRWKFMSLPSTDTITRIRRKLQEKGQFKATDQVARHRRWKSMAVQQRMPKTAPEKVDNLINEPLF